MNNFSNNFNSMEKLNIAEHLKDCAKGTKLYSPLFGDVLFEKVINNMIYINTEKEYVFSFDKYGRYKEYTNSECLLFPSKENRDWSTFQRPFKDGDIVVAEDNELFQMFILKEVEYHENDSYDGHCYFGWNFNYNELFCEGLWGFNRFATEEEKQKLFDAIKANGYKWNPETKTLDKLIEPKFKVGDRIRFKTCLRQGNVVIEIKDTHYILDDDLALPFTSQEYYELVSNKFDITTLKPFESRVLVRDVDHNEWEGAIFGRYDGKAFFTIGGLDWRYCIPYKGNEHLLGTTNNCNDYYKTWE